MSVNHVIILPQIPAYPANYMPMHGKKMTGIKKSVACVPTNEKTKVFRNEIFQRPVVGGFYLFNDTFSVTQTI
jgi:hypothetical protein